MLKSPFKLKRFVLRFKSSHYVGDVPWTIFPRVFCSTLDVSIMLSQTFLEVIRIANVYLLIVSFELRSKDVALMTVFFFKFWHFLKKEKKKFFSHTPEKKNK